MSADTYLFVFLFAFEHFFQIILFKTVRRTGFGQSSQRIGEVILKALFKSLLLKRLKISNLNIFSFPNFFLTDITFYFQKNSKIYIFSIDLTQIVFLQIFSFA